MTYGLTLPAPSSTLAVSLADLKSHLRVDYTDDDALITTLALAAAQFFETQTNLSIINKTYVMTLADWPIGDFINLPRAPVQSVTSVQYLDTSGVWQTLSVSNYQVDITSQPACVIRGSGAIWPSVKNEAIPAVKVTFVAGYGTDSTAVPVLIQAAIKFITAHWFYNREAATSTQMSDLPFAVTAIINSHRVGWL